MLVDINQEKPALVKANTVFESRADSGAQRTLGLASNKKIGIRRIGAQTTRLGGISQKLTNMKGQAGTTSENVE